MGRADLCVDGKTRGRVERDVNREPALLRRRLREGTSIEPMAGLAELETVERL